MDSNVEKFSDYIDSRYITSVLTQAILQSSYDIRDKGFLFDNQDVFKEWADIVRLTPDPDVATQRIMESLHQHGIRDAESVMPYILNILKNKESITQEIKERVVSEHLTLLQTSQSFDDFQSMEHPFDEARGDVKLRAIAERISWRMALALIDAKYPGARDGLPFK